jgi:hypothetical protein
VAGAGRRVFQPGEVLTASNVMNYLQDQAVMVFAGSAARGSAIGTAVSEGMVSYLQNLDQVQYYDGTQWEPVNRALVVSGTAQRAQFLPSPVQGDTVFRSDLGYAETYYDAHGTANPGGRGTASAWYPNQRNMGLVPIVPPTVNVSGGSATANTLGQITFTTATSISLNDVFSTSYSTYKIVVGVTNASATGLLNLRFRSAGTDNTAAQHQTGFAATNINTGAVTAFNALNSQAWIINSLNISFGNQAFSDLTVHNASKSGLKKTASMSGIGNNGANYSGLAGGLICDTTTAFDGFTIYPASGNMNGTVQVFGYNA